MVGRAEHVGGDADVDAVIRSHQAGEHQGRTVDLNPGRFQYRVATLSDKMNDISQSGWIQLNSSSFRAVDMVTQRAQSGSSSISQAVFYAASCKFTGDITSSVTFEINRSFSVLAKMNASVVYKRLRQT